MKFITSNYEQKSWQDKKFCEVSLTDEQGNVVDRVSDWTNTITGNNQEVNGIIEKNAKGFPTFKSAQKVAGANFATAKKDESIQKAQERTSQGVANAGSITNATHLVVAMLNANIYPMKSEQMVKDKVRELIVWYRELYENPNAVAPF